MLAMKGFTRIECLKDHAFGRIEWLQRGKRKRERETRQTDRLTDTVVTSCVRVRPLAWIKLAVILTF